MLKPLNWRLPTQSSIVSTRVSSLSFLSSSPGNLQMELIHFLVSTVFWLWYLQTFPLLGGKDD